MVGTPALSLKTNIDKQAWKIMCGLLFDIWRGELLLMVSDRIWPEKVVDVVFLGDASLILRSTIFCVLFGTMMVVESRREFKVGWSIDIGDVWSCVIHFMFGSFHRDGWHSIRCCVAGMLLIVMKLWGVSRRLLQMEFHGGLKEVCWWLKGELHGGLRRVKAVRRYGDELKMMVMVFGKEEGCSISSDLLVVVVICCCVVDARCC